MTLIKKINIKMKKFQNFKNNYDVISEFSHIYWYLCLPKKGDVVLKTWLAFSDSIFIFSFKKLLYMITNYDTMANGARIAPTPCALCNA